MRGKNIYHKFQLLKPIQHTSTPYIRNSTAMTGEQCNERSVFLSLSLNAVMLFLQKAER